MSAVTEGPGPDGAGQPDAGTDSLAAAAAAGPPLDCIDQDLTPAAPSRTVAANEADPMHSIYGAPPTDGDAAE